MQNVTANKLFNALDEVEYEPFGHGRIVRITFSGKILVKFDDIDVPIPVDNPAKLKLIVSEETKQEIDDEGLIRAIEDTTEEDDAITKRIKEVLKVLNEQAASTEYGVPVLGLPCGTGKSSAISRKICQVVAAYENGSKNGMLIIANTKSQLSDYLDPLGNEVKDFIIRHRQNIVQWDSDSSFKEIKRAKYAPVLMITGKRYMNEKMNLVLDKFLTFGNGCKRSLIIMDEEPQLYKVLDISVKELNDVDSLIVGGIGDKVDQQEKEYLMRFWRKWSGIFKKKLSDCENRAKQSGQSKYYELVGGKTEPDIDLSNFGKIYIHDRFFETIRKYRYLMKFNIGEDIEIDAYDCIEALRYMVRHVGVYEYSTQPYYSRFIVLADSEQHLFDHTLRGIKLMIFDGTADISPVYHLANFRLVDCSRFQREYKNLTIRLYNQASGKSSMSMTVNGINPGFSALTRIIKKDIAPQIPSDEEWAVFTYKYHKESIGAALEDFTKIKLGHFGKLRGKNDYNKMKHIVQVGMNRWPEMDYFTFYYTSLQESSALIHIPQQYKNNIGLLTETRGHDVSNLVKVFAAETKQCMEDFLLCDIEQNLFRGVIRSSDEIPFTFHLFLSFKEYRNLIERIRQRYCSHGATIEFINKKDTSEDAFFTWYNEKLKNGEEYDNQQVMEIVGFKGAKIQDYLRSHSRVKELLDRDKVKQNKYVKGGKAALNHE